MPFQKITFSKKKTVVFKIISFIEKKNSILLVFKYQDYAIQPKLSSPPHFRIQGESPKCDKQTNDEGRTEIHVSYIGLV